MIFYSEKKEAGALLNYLGAAPTSEHFNWVARFQRNKFAVTRVALAAVSGLLVASAAFNLVKGEDKAVGALAGMGVLSGLVARKHHKQYGFYAGVSAELGKPNGVAKALGMVRAAADGKPWAPKAD